MLKRFLILLVICTLHTVYGYAQTDTINQTDNKGLKQGYWEKNFPDGKTMYKGYFKDGKPYGTMIRYYESGTIKATIDFFENNKSKVIFYYEDESKAADGYYTDNIKDSCWNYFSYYDKVLKATENYKNGKKSGKAYVYYTTGKIFDESNWVDGKKEGEWIQYFQNGNMKMLTYYENDILYGCFNTYFEDGNPEIVGRYEYNVRQGDWYFYNDKGEQLLLVKYENGKALNQDILDSKQKEFFDQMEENIGKIKEPTLDDVGGF